MPYDENGWATGPVAALPPTAAWSLLSPDRSARVVLPRWAHQARTFFRAVLDIVQHKKYPDDRTPERDAFDLVIRRESAGPATNVLVVTVPIEAAPAIRAAADAGVVAIGGAGFDALVARTARVWQVSDKVESGGDERAPLAVAAVLSSVLLAPIVPPGGVTIFGVKGARERLAARGWS